MQPGSGLFDTMRIPWPYIALQMLRLCALHGASFVLLWVSLHADHICQHLLTLLSICSALSLQNGQVSLDTINYMIPEA